MFPSPAVGVLVGYLHYLSWALPDMPALLPRRICGVLKHRLSLATQGVRDVERRRGHSLSPPNLPQAPHDFRFHGLFDTRRGKHSGDEIRRLWIDFAIAPESSISGFGIRAVNSWRSDFQALAQQNL
jgi:hypothetical protein